jgi:general secretion pathway protein D
MKKAVALIAIAGALWGCAVLSQSYRLGNEAEINKNWDEAIKLYERAALENPREPVYRLALLRARSAAGLSAIQTARSLAADGQRDAAIAAYKKTISYDPLNRAVRAEMEAFVSPPPAPVKPSEEDLMTPIRLRVSEERVKLKFTDAPLRSIFAALGKHAGVNFIYDEQFRDVPMTIDLTDRTFQQAVSFLCLASKNFSRIADEKTVIVVPDQPMKRLQYEANAIRTFYLSNLVAADVQNSLAMMVRTQYKAPSIIVDKNLNSITIRDTPSGVRLAEKLIRTWDKSKGEVIVDLEIMEVSRVKMKKLGLDLGDVGSNSLGLRYSGGDTIPESGWLGLNGLNFSKSGNFQISLPTAYLQMIASDSETRIIAQPRLRGVGSEEIKYVVGQKVPVPQTTFTPIAAGGVSQQPVVNYEYKDVGIDVKMKPRIHTEKEVTLELEIKITSLAGTGIADLPIIATREVKNVIRLKDGETNLLAGLLRDEERKSLKGIAGLKDIPILGNLFSNNNTTVEQTDVILTITPYIIRTIPLTEEDSKPLWVDVEGLSAMGSGQRTPGDEPIEETEAVSEESENPSANTVLLNPSNFEIPKGREFRLSVELRTELEIGSLAATLNFDPQILKLKDVVEGGLVRQMGDKVPFLKNIDPSGVCTIGLSSPVVGKGFRGGGILAVLVFESIASGEATVDVASVSSKGATGQPVPFDMSSSRIVVR